MRDLEARGSVGSGGQLQAARQSRVSEAPRLPAPWGEPRRERGAVAEAARPAWERGSCRSVAGRDRRAQTLRVLRWDTRGEKAAARRAEVSPAGGVSVWPLFCPQGSATERPRGLRLRVQSGLNAPGPLASVRRHSGARSPRPVSVWARASLPGDPGAAVPSVGPALTRLLQGGVWRLVGWVPDPPQPPLTGCVDCAAQC